MKRCLLVLVIAFIGLGAVAVSAETPAKRYQVPLEESPVTGPADAPVTVVEFLDFQ